MKKTLLVMIAAISLTSTAYAYDADCKLENGKQFSISVNSKVMVVDNKWKVFYKGKSLTGWYKYENKGYKYDAGKFDDGQFPIEVTNKYEDEMNSGTCFLK